MADGRIPRQLRVKTRRPGGGNRSVSSFSFSKVGNQSQTGQGLADGWDGTRLLGLAEVRPLPRWPSDWVEAPPPRGGVRGADAGGWLTIFEWCESTQRNAHAFAHAPKRNPAGPAFHPCMHTPIEKTLSRQWKVLSGSPFLLPYPSSRGQLTISNGRPRQGSRRVGVLSLPSELNLIADWT